MKSALSSVLFLEILAVTESLVVAPPRTPFSGRNILSATASSSPSGGPNAQSSSAWGVRSSGAGISSKTACESAVNVEWEPMSELERRIEDGVYYEHLTDHYQVQKQQQKRDRMPGCHPKAKRIVETEEDDDSPGVRAVFCGYRYTPDDYNRLKSADVA